MVTLRSLLFTILLPGTVTGFVPLTLAHLFVIFYEEPTLRRQFGASYEAYLRSVPRWIPRRV